MTQLFQQVFLYSDILLTALMVPLAVAVVVLMLREHFYKLWTPAVDVFAVLLASELVIMFEHKRLSVPAIPVDLIQGAVTLFCITLPLFVGSLIVEAKVLQYYFPKKGKPRGSGARKRTILLWASAVTIFAGQLALLMGQNRPDNATSQRMESKK